MRADRYLASTPYVEPLSDARTTLAAFFNILLRGLGVPMQEGHWNLRLQLSPHGNSSAHPVTIDDRIDNVAAGDTTQTTHPHRQITFSDIEQIVTDHETVASEA